LESTLFNSTKFKSTEVKQNLANSLKDEPKIKIMSSPEGRKSLKFSNKINALASSTFK